MHGKLNSLDWYCCLWKRMAISLSLTNSAGWSWLLWMYQTNSTDSTRRQSSKLGLWSPVFKAGQIIRNCTELQWVLIINCQPQTVQAAICRLVPDTEWSGGKTRLFQAMLSRQHRWIYLQWLSTIGSLPFPMMAASWSSSVTKVNQNIMNWSCIQSTTPPHGSAFRITRLGIEIWSL